MTEANIAYEEFIPTDKWSLQDWYLLKMVRLERIYNRLMRGKYSGGVDKRALIEFYSEVCSYNQAASENFKKHLVEKDYARFLLLINDRPENIGPEKAEELMALLSSFHWKSGLSKLSESRPMGDFAYARKKLGLNK